MLDFNRTNCQRSTRVLRAIILTVLLLASLPTLGITQEAKPVEETQPSFQDVISTLKDMKDSLSDLLAQCIVQQKVLTRQLTAKKSEAEALKQALQGKDSPPVVDK